MIVAEEEGERDREGEKRYKYLKMKGPEELHALGPCSMGIKLDYGEKKKDFLSIHIQGQTAFPFAAIFLYFCFLWMRVMLIVKKALLFSAL